MTIAFTLLIASAALGLAIGLFFRVWTIALASLPIAILSAIVLQSYDFGFAAGMSITIGCLVTSQLAYLAGVLVASRAYGAADLTQEEIDGDPGGGSEQRIRDDDE